MNGNYIKISRSLLDWCWYHDVNTCRLFIHMLLRVNWKKGYFGEEVIERGSFVSSISKLSAETGLSEREVRTALEHLKKTGEVTCKRHTKYSVYTVVNYCKYQSSDRQNDIQNDIENDTRNDTSADSLTTGKRHAIEERKKERRKNNSNIGRFEPPDVEMVRAYCQERENQVDPQAFVDFYESKGWMVGKNKMKNWKAAVRTWEKESQRRSQTRKEETAKRGSTGFNNFTERDYNMDRMERALLGIPGGESHAD